MSMRSLLMLLCLSMVGCSSLPSDPATGHFVSRQLTVDGRLYRYQVFVPAPPHRQGPVPVVLFLHGSGERGSDGRQQADAGVGPYLRRHLGDFPALVVMPQVPDEQEWNGVNATMALQALDAASAEFNGDPQRTYLTGMSMGGYGTWEIALQQPQRFAALVPVCGAILSPHEDREYLVVTPVAELPDPYTALAERLQRIPVWMFHGAEDDVVLPHDDRKIYRAFKNLDADVRYTEYPEGNHNAWDATYRDPKMWQWLFAQKRGGDTADAAPETATGGS
ncbi:prolyl oligopeptidase family serine peptidase [Xanthomonas sp. CFBP 8703]|uniref:Prolyl oligopeptidase family serine peptidase n=1 Tax=Xanthomonas bonasiae TaxID=2810351 RepID=A0ABS3AZL7_9XANT|nr:MULTISPECIES: prolyl oligopeptidase family serine peptidase [Xanthomonas]MBD7923027.1 prolyl oligopeptidase family serine peptidase [Xanthomonas surreyensis]MBN6101787.1 prolyl oligopeptidase family serine peptidase [Xanthomonas bonasiae]MBN6111664.1 prolyl oligopeptidase family serine peptidase [Xanthomonas bonasiae]